MPVTPTGPMLEIGDVEVQETEARTQACVALLVDTSFSMAMDGRWVPMKRTALALHTLIKSRFRGDDLQLIGFGRHAEVMDIEQLTGLDAMWDKGTNLHHALLLANRHFRKHPNAQPVLLIVTDGEPTSHLEPDGEVYFSYPPHPLTVAYAVRELDNAGRLGAQTTFFRLGEDPGLARFIDSMAQRVDGRVVAPELDDLGAAVVGSYLGSRGRGRRGRLRWRRLRRLVRRPRLLGRRLSRGTSYGRCVPLLHPYDVLAAGRRRLRSTGHQASCRVRRCQLAHGLVEVRPTPAQTGGSSGAVELVGGQVADEQLAAQPVSVEEDLAVAEATDVAEPPLETGRRG